MARSLGLVLLVIFGKLDLPSGEQTSSGSANMLIMSRKSIVWAAVFVGSIIGGYIPVLFGSSLLSYFSLFGNAIGGIIGIWVGSKIADGMGA